MLTKIAKSQSRNLYKQLFKSTQFKFSEAIEREQMEYDVVIVGGGPAGLSTAIKLKQLEEQKGREINVCVVEKGSEVGAHILSGNCFEVKVFDELFPDWRNMENRPPIDTKVTHDKFLLLTENNSVEIPQFLMPKSIHNEGNYIISLNNLTRWLGEQAEELGVDIFPETAADQIIYGENNQVKGIVTKDLGIAKNGEEKDTFTPGIELLAKQTVFAEGVRGSCSEQLINKFNLRKGKDPQIYGIGIKEVWEVKDENFESGLVQHTAGWPMDMKTYGGSFMYHQSPEVVHVGYVVGLNYSNPYLNPYEEFQRWKNHKEIRKYLEGGSCVSYGARAINAGGYYAIPKLTVPGGMLVGCSAGFLNVAKIKGTHTAIKSGIVAAETIFEQIDKNVELTDYETKLQKSFVYDELHKSRNAKSAFKGGLLQGLTLNFVSQMFFNGKEPWNLRNDKKDSDISNLTIKQNAKKIEYPKHDGKLTFDLLENLARSGTNHDHDQPSHLRIKEDKQQSNQISLQKYAGIETKFCPANVYEFVEDEAKEGEYKLQINAQNCLHCKTCDIKMVDEYINWTVPESGGGPNYSNM